MKITRHSWYEGCVYNLHFLQTNWTTLTWYLVHYCILPHHQVSLSKFVQRPQTVQHNWWFGVSLHIKNVLKESIKSTQLPRVVDRKNKKRHEAIFDCFRKTRAVGQSNSSVVCLNEITTLTANNQWLGHHLLLQHFNRLFHRFILCSSDRNS